MRFGPEVELLGPLELSRERVSRPQKALSAYSPTSRSPKLFTRIKEENDRRLIEDFLTQTP